MEVRSEETACCALAELDGLAYGGDAHEQMMDFCEQVMYQEDYDYVTGTYKRMWSQDTIGNHYIFTAVVKYVKESKGQKSPKYGPQFKAFILKNKLGTVVEGAAKPNRLNHPDHIVKAYIWNPHITNLKAWYKTQLKKDGKDLTITKGAVTL